MKRGLRIRFFLTLCRFVLLLGVFWLTFAGVTLSAATDDSEYDIVMEANSDEKWQSCSVFLAPTTMGWGVYAARDFRADEIIELAPMFLPVAARSRVCKNSILDDYTYVSMQSDKHRDVIFGMSLFYNHHPSPNARITMLGGETKAKGPHISGFIALRDIQAGEEIFTTYSHTDGGEEWFHHRGLEIRELEKSRIAAEHLEIYQEKFCSKVYTGVGRPTLQNKLVEFPGDLSWFAPFDAGIGDARAKTNITEGERIDITIGLPLLKQYVDGTILAAVAIPVADLDAQSQNNLIFLRHAGHLTVTYRGRDTKWEKTDGFSDFENLSILPVGGNSGLLKRVGDDPTSNCRLQISWQGSNSGSEGILLELFATKDIITGDILKVNLKPPDSAAAHELLKSALDKQGVHVGSPSFFEGVASEL